MLEDPAYAELPMRQFLIEAKCMQLEIDDMIWEVDEDCDQAVNWQEFQAMYRRCCNDQAGKNLRQIAFKRNITCFAIFT